MIALGDSGYIYYHSIAANITADFPLVQNLFIYPNPANNSINIVTNEFNVGELKIFNTNGQLVYKDALESIKENNLDIDITSFSPGIYFVQLTVDNQHKTGKFLVCR